MVLNYIFYKLKKPVFFFLLSILTACSGVEDFSTNSKPVVEKTPPIPEPTPDFKPSPTPKSNINLMPIYPHPTGDKVFMAYLSPNNFQSPAFDVTKIKFEKLTHIVMFGASSDVNGHVEFRPTVESAIFTRYPANSKTFADFCNVVANEADNYGVKVMLGLAEKPTLKPVFENALLRATFIQSVINFVVSRGMDGVDLDYEYPFTVAEGDVVINFVKELREGFNAAGYPNMIITKAMPKSSWYGKNFNVDELLKYVTWLNIMTYGYDASFTSYFGHNEPLYKNPEVTYDSWSVEETMNYYHVTRGISKNKLVVGLSFFGFKHYRFNTLFGTKPQGSTNQPKSTSPGYKSILADLNNTAVYTYHWDDYAKVPYLTTSNNSIKEPYITPNTYSNVMVTYDDEQSTRIKCEYINDQGYLGAMIWHLGAGWLDDVANPISNNQPLLDAAAPYFGR